MPKQCFQYFKNKLNFYKIVYFSEKLIEQAHNYIVINNYNNSEVLDNICINAINIKQ